MGRTSSPRRSCRGFTTDHRRPMRSQRLAPSRGACCSLDRYRSRPQGAERHWPDESAESTRRCQADITRCPNNCSRSIDSRASEELAGETIGAPTRRRLSWQDLDLVASTSQGTPVDRHSLARSLRLLCNRTDIIPAITPYELRHTAISLQADSGVSSWEIADWAGTSEAMISSVYRHRLRRVSTLRPVRE